MANVPIIRFDQRQADAAYEAFAALRRAAQENPGLVENPYFTALQDTAYARFLLAFEAMQ